MNRRNRKLQKIIPILFMLLSFATDAIASSWEYSDQMPPPPNNIYRAYRKIGDKYYYTGQNGHVYWTRHPEQTYSRTIPSKFAPGEYYSPDDLYGSEANHNYVCPDGSCKIRAKSLRGQRLAKLPVSAAPAPSRYSNLGEVKVPAAGSLLERFSNSAWKNAIAGRTVADMCGGGYRSGNRSKCKCAEGVEQALVQSGVCNGGLYSPNAVDLVSPSHYGARSSSAINSTTCPALHPIQGSNPYDAPIGSVIVYWTTRHTQGHTESVVAANAQSAAALHVAVGTKIYCSDWCQVGPFLGIDRYHRVTNFVSQIFSL